MKDRANNKSAGNVGSDIVQWNNGVFSHSSRVFAWNGYDAINLSAKCMILNEAGKHIQNKKFWVIYLFVYLFIRQLGAGDSSVDIARDY
jgi:hypothetical protein